MRTLVMTVILAITAMVNAFAGNVLKDFVYNEVMNGNQVESQIVYKVKAGKILNPHLKYIFKYDADNRILQKEVLKWGEIEQAFRRHYCLSYNYNEAGIEVEYALWDNNIYSYSDLKEKVVYLQTGHGVNYMNYKWNEKDNDWSLLVEPITTDEGMQLLVENKL